MTDYKKAREDLEVIEENKGNVYPFSVKDLWGFDSRTDEHIINVGLWAGQNQETILKALRIAEAVEKEPRSGETEIHIVQYSDGEVVAIEKNVDLGEKVKRLAKVKVNWTEGEGL